MRFLGFIFLLCFSISSKAVVVADLYDVQIIVEDQSPKVLNQAMREALQQVFVKVSGSAESLSNQSIMRASNSAMSFVKSYRYTHLDDQLVLQVQFAQKQIDNQLKQANQPIWGRNRPLLLIWQAIEIDRQRVMLNQQHPLLPVEFEQAMKKRGLPILWPSLDLEDQINLPANHLWGLFRDEIELASNRYLTDAFLAGKLSLNLDDLWQYQGYLQLQGSQLPIQLEHAEQAVLLQQLADQAAEFLAQHYAIIETDSSDDQQIAIVGIENFKQYQQLLDYLNANIAIKKVRVVSISGDRVKLALELSTDWAKAWQTLSFDKRLGETDELQVYRWVQ